MFKFTMDAKDADDYQPEKLAAAGIEEHYDGRMAIDRVCFIAKDLSPKDLDEALEIIQQVFFFQPIKVWIDGKKYDPLKDPNKFVKIAKIGRPI